MEVPKLCFHRETQWNIRRQDDGRFGRYPPTYEGYFVDWQPPQNPGPFSQALLAIECHILPSWIADDRQPDGSYHRLAHWGIKLIYHTPIRRYRPLAYLGGDGPRRRHRLERLALECRWQEGAEFVPAVYKPAPCWEGRLLYGFSDRVLRAYVTGDEAAVFEALRLVWARVFKRQYEFYLRLAD